MRLELTSTDWCTDLWTDLMCSCVKRFDGHNVGCESVILFTCNRVFLLCCKYCHLFFAMFAGIEKLVPGGWWILGFTVWNGHSRVASFQKACLLWSNLLHSWSQGKNNNNNTTDILLPFLRKPQVIALLCAVLWFVLQQKVYWENT